MRLLIVIAGICLFGVNNGLLAQGCSDAGFCSVGNLGIHSNNEQAKHNLQISTSIG